MVEAVVAYPVVEEVCKMFDLTVLADIREAEGEEHEAPCPKVDADGEECTCKPIQCYAIGANSELSAGLRGFSMSPYFDNMEQLEAWAVRNLERLKGYADSEIAPDASNWA